MLHSLYFLNILLYTLDTNTDHVNALLDDTPPETAKITNILKSSVFKKEGVFVPGKSIQYFNPILCLV